MLFCESPPAEHYGAFAHDGEVLEVIVIDRPVATAFPLHDAMVARFFG